MNGKGKGAENRINPWALKWAAFLLFLLPTLSPATEPIKILVLKSSDFPAFDEAILGFRRAFTLKNPSFSLVVNTLPDAPAQAQSFLSSMESEKPSVILAMGTRAARMARARVAFAPVVYCMVLEGDGDLAYGGVTLEVPLVDRVSRAIQSLEGSRKVGLIYNSAKLSAPLEEMNSLEKKGLLIVTPAASPMEVDRAVDILRDRVDCLLLTPDQDLYPPLMLGAFFQQTIAKNLPLVGFSPTQVRAGAVASFSADYANNGERAAEVVSRVLAGENLREIPVLPPTKIVASFNLAVARHFNRKISPEAVKTAVEVVR